MKYNLSHLNQDEDQQVFGPIQDDEALLLYAVIRTMRLHNILEIGGLQGYSAKNFIEALHYGNVFSIDVNEMPKLADNHYVIKKNCADIEKDDIFCKLDLIFFDAHAFEEQLKLFSKLLEFQLLDDSTILAFHDTNLHPFQTSKTNNVKFIESENAWLCIGVERNLVNFFKTIGYDAISFHTKMDEKSIPFRHGITLMQKFKEFKNQ